MQQCEWLLLFHDGGPYYIEIVLPTGFFMIRNSSVTKELNYQEKEVNCYRVNKSKHQVNVQEIKLSFKLRHI